MSGTLTTWNDEQLRGLADHADSLLVRDLAGGFLSLRAERAKPTPGDEERARELIKDIECNGDDDPNPWDVMRAENAFASIRAESSAEREKLEAALRRARAFIAIAAMRNKSVMAAKMLPEIDAVLDPLAQPAESGATE